MLSFFPRDVLDGILNLIESVSEGFPTYSCLSVQKCITKINEYGMLVSSKLFQQFTVVHLWSLLHQAWELQAVLFHQEPPDLTTLCLRYTCNETKWATISNGIKTSVKLFDLGIQLNPTALRRAKIVYNFGLSACNRVKRVYKLKFNVPTTHRSKRNNPRLKTYSETP